MGSWNLENLVRVGKLAPHAARRGEIEGLFAAADRALSDAANETVDADARFGLAYRAMLHAAMAGMLAHGFRPVPSEPTPDRILLDSLPRTAGIDPRRVPLFEAFRAARSRVDFCGEAVADGIARESVDEARRLVADVRTWVRANVSVPE